MKELVRLQCLRDILEVLAHETMKVATMGSKLKHIAVSAQELSAIDNFSRYSPHVYSGLRGSVQGVYRLATFPARSEGLIQYTLRALQQE